MAIIGLVGYKGSGKTTACNIIKKHLDNVVQINFKDALVQELKDNFPDLLCEIAQGMPQDCVPEEQEPFHDNGANYQPGYICTSPSFDDLFTLKPPLVRTLMQNYGTNVRRADESHYWVNEWIEKILDHRESTILVDDVRFLNEAGTVQGYGGTLIRLERTDLEATDTHLSETEQQQIECDYTISVGQGELDKLEAELVKILNVHHT